MHVPISPGALILLRIRVFGGSASREMDGVLDTGASFVTIPPEDAIDLGYDLASAPKVTVSTANGPIQVSKITLPRVELGPHAADDVAAICLDIAGGGVSSLVGLSLISRFNITIDNKAGILTISDL